MEEELLRKAEQLARLLLTPEEIGDLMALESEQVAEFSNPYSDAGRMYRRVLAEKSKELHEQTLRLASVGSPSAVEEANGYLRKAQASIE